MPVAKSLRPRCHASRPVISAAALILAAWGGLSLASPPPIPRSQLPRIEGQIRSADAKRQLAGLNDLINIERGITADLIRLLPPVLELTASTDETVASSALYLVGQYQWLPAARKEHGKAMIRTLAKAMRSKSAKIREMAIYSCHATLVKEHEELGIPLLLSAARDGVEQVRIWAVITMGKFASPNEKLIAALRAALGDKAVQVRRQAALSLAEHAPHSKAAIPELLKAVRDKSGEVAGGAAHALSKMGDPAVEPLLKLAEDSEASVRRSALYALATAYATIKLSDQHGRRIDSVIKRMLADADAKVRLAAAIRVSYLGDLDASAAAAPILAKHATGPESVDGWNAYIGLHRSIRMFAAGLTDPKKADAAYGGLKQFDEAYLKAYLLESQQKFKGSERGDLRPLLAAAAKKGAKAEHRKLAAEMLSWLQAQQ